MTASLLPLNGRLGARSRSLLNRGHVSRILAAPSMEQAFVVFLDTGYASEVSLDREPSLAELDAILDAGLADITRIMRHADTDQLLSELLLSRMSQMHALAVLLQYSSGEEVSYESNLSYYSTSQYLQILEGERGSQRLQFLRPALQQARDILSADPTSEQRLMAQMMVQKAFYARDLQIVQKLRSPTLDAYLRHRHTADMVRSAVRRPDFPALQTRDAQVISLQGDALTRACQGSVFSRQYEKGRALKSEGADLTNWELEFESELISLLRAQRLSDPTSYGAAICFFLTKLRNAEILRVLFSYKSLGLSSQEIEERSGTLFALLPAS